MTLKIRLRKQGRKNRPFYRLVLADIRSPRDGKYVEMLGWYNPFEAEDEKNALIDGERIEHWLEQGAQLSEKAEALVARKAPAVMKRYKERQHTKRMKKIADRKKRRNKAAA